MGFLITSPSTGGTGGASGTAGGVLSGTYPNPSFAADMATQAELDANLGSKLNLTGGALIGALSFSGTNHAGLRFNNLTTVQRDAIASPLAGMAIWNTTTSRLSIHDGSTWTAGFVRAAGDSMSGALSVGLAALGTSTSPAFNLINSTAALVGNQVQVSPALIFEGHGWKTNATAGSQSVRFRQSVLPIAGAAAPTGMMLFQSDINGTNTWTNRLGVGFGSVSSVNGLYTEMEGGIYFAGIGSGNQNNVGVSGTGVSQLNFHCNGGITHSIINNTGQGLMQVFNAGGFAWSSTGTTSGGADMILLRAAAASLQLGANHATTATNQTIKAHNVTTGIGANLILSGGTGSVANGVVIISRLPTSNPGPGILWNNAGTPAIGT